MSHPLDRLKYHVSGAIERGEGEAVVEIRARRHPRPKIGDIYYAYGFQCRICKIYPAGTMDVEEIDGPHAYRVSGLSFR